MSIKQPRYCGEVARISGGDTTVINLSNDALDLSGITLRTFAEAVLDPESDFQDGDTIEITARKDDNNYASGTAVYDASTPKLTVVWGESKGVIGANDYVDVYARSNGHLTLANVQGGNEAEQYHLDLIQYNYTAQIDQNLGRNDFPTFAGQNIVNAASARQSVQSQSNGIVETRLRNTVGDYSFYVSSVNAFVFYDYNGGTARIIIDADGDVAIGRANATAKLHVGPGGIIFDDLPTTAPAAAGSLWNNGGVVNIV